MSEEEINKLGRAWYKAIDDVVRADTYSNRLELQVHAAHYLYTILIAVMKKQNEDAETAAIRVLLACNSSLADERERIAKNTLPEARA